VSPVALLVIAKQPVAGRAKTRLTPPCSPAQAATLAGAALLDTLDVVARTAAARKVLVFDGDARGWRPDGFTLIAQRGNTLGERLEAAFEDVPGPALLIGMDTPQMTPELLLDGMSALTRRDVDAVLGPTVDGGYWSVGFRDSVPRAFEGVPMSSPRTWAHQRARFEHIGLRVHEQALLRDVDTIDDARAVASRAPQTRFAQALWALA
jgi:rSAM/selenodomain-associated transferase 1